MRRCCGGWARIWGTLASRDLKARCRDGPDHGAEAWAGRKRELTPLSLARWAGAITRATHEQWAPAHRCTLAHLQSLQAGIRTLRHRLSLPLGQEGSKRAPGGYRSRREWHARARRLRVLEDRLERERADGEAGRVHVVRGGGRLARMRHQLPAAELTETRWRGRWEAARWFLRADGESGKRYGNETIRITPDGEVSLKLPVPLSNPANAPHPPERWMRDRTVQAGPDTPGREETLTRLPGPRTRSVPPDAERKRATRTPNTVRGVRSEQEWVKDSLDGFPSGSLGPLRQLQARHAPSEREAHRRSPGPLWTATPPPPPASASRSGSTYRRSRRPVPSTTSGVDALTR
ncbi:hypothetical protein SHIRM173S_08364 [Streptomyces hirsutus]